MLKKSNLTDDALINFQTFKKLAFDLKQAVPPKQSSKEDKKPLQVHLQNTTTDSAQLVFDMPNNPATVSKVPVTHFNQVFRFQFESSKDFDMNYEASSSNNSKRLQEDANSNTQRKKMIIIKTSNKKGGQKEQPSNQRNSEGKVPL